MLLLLLLLLSSFLLLLLFLLWFLFLPLLRSAWIRNHESWKGRGKGKGKGKGRITGSGGRSMARTTRFVNNPPVVQAVRLSPPSILAIAQAAALAAGLTAIAGCSPRSMVPATEASAPAAVATVSFHPIPPEDARALLEETFRHCDEATVEAIDRTLAWLDGACVPDGRIGGDLHAALSALRRALVAEADAAAFAGAVLERFDLMEADAASVDHGSVHFTAYFAPVHAARPRRCPGFEHPLHAIPPE